MTNNNTTQLGYFIDRQLWKDGLALLNFQIDQKKKNKHFNTLSMFYYDKLDKKLMFDEEYFDIKISNSLFYGLKKEFDVMPYVIPKTGLGLGLRNYKFFTYPMRVVYYAVGLYLFRLSEEFLNNDSKGNERIKAYYGGSLSYQENKIQLNNSDKIYYRNHYKEFKSECKKEGALLSQDRKILKLDIENYFDELSISRLLELLGDYVKPTKQVEMHYDTFTREQIGFFFKFISRGKSGIPQSDNDIISSFIGYLYLVFGDLCIDDILGRMRMKDDISSYKIIRYTDDIYISITFKSRDEKLQDSLIHSIATEIADILYRDLGLKLNHRKTRLFREEDKEEFVKNLRKTSHGDESYVAEEEQKPEEKLNKIFDELKKIKEYKIVDYYSNTKIRDDSKQKDILKNVFDSSVQNMLKQDKNKIEIANIFKNFNFDLVKLEPLAISCILVNNLQDNESVDKFIEFCLDKSRIAAGDADLITRFLCQTDFNSEKLLDKLQDNDHMGDIIKLFRESKLNCEKPGYYNLSCMQIRKLSKMPNVIEQTKLRVFNERIESYSVALNHLVNEIQAICFNLDRQDNSNQKGKKREFNAKVVVEFLQRKGVKHKICTKVRNLFDRRNSNRISHHGSDTSPVWEVKKEEYLDYYSNVGECLEFLL